MESKPTDTTAFHYLLIRCDDDGAIHGVELDDFQVTLETTPQPRFHMETGALRISLSGQQVDIIKKWWREP